MCQMNVSKECQNLRFPTSNPPTYKNDLFCFFKLHIIIKQNNHWNKELVLYVDVVLCVFDERYIGLLDWIFLSINKCGPMGG